MPLPPRTADTMSMAIAMSSPSGRMSKRARVQAESALHAALFGSDYDLKGERPAPTVEEKRARLIQRATELRQMAARGMQPRAFPKEAARLEAEAASMGAEVTV